MPSSSSRPRSSWSWLAWLPALLFVAWLGAVLAPREALAENYVPVARYWEVSAPGANTDAITDLTWRGRGYPRLTIQCDTSTVVNLMCSRDGTENALGANSNTALVAGATYVFDFPGVQPGDVLNVQVETDSAIAVLELGDVRNTQ